MEDRKVESAWFVLCIIGHAVKKIIEKTAQELVLLLDQQSMFELLLLSLVAHIKTTQANDLEKPFFQFEQCERPLGQLLGHW